MKCNRQQGPGESPPQKLKLFFVYESINFCSLQMREIFILATSRCKRHGYVYASNDRQSALGGGLNRLMFVAFTEGGDRSAPLNTPLVND